MITNSSITIYHKVLDNQTRLEKWERFNYNDVWFFGGKGASINKGYENANDFSCRIPYGTNNIELGNLAIGDIVIQGTLNTNIDKQQDLANYQVYNIVTIIDNNFGNNPHIHIGGK